MLDDVQAGELEPWIVHLAPAVTVTAAQFRQVCQANRDWRFELTAGGDLVIMPPTGGETGAISARLTAQLVTWADQDGSGLGFDSSTGFVLPNGAIRSPDAAWVRRDRLARLPRARLRGFVPLCPDFVVELKSQSDPLKSLQTKLREYVDNGARLGWLIDPITRTVHVYRPRTSVARLRRPATLAGDPVLPGFVLDFTPIWRPGV